MAAHSGFLEVATAILEDIEEQGVLRHVLYEHEGGLLAKGWEVVVCGHSLGAGLTALIGLYLRKFLPGCGVGGFRGTHCAHCTDCLMH